MEFLVLERVKGQDKEIKMPVPFQVSKIFHFKYHLKIWLLTGTALHFFQQKGLFIFYKLSE